MPDRQPLDSSLKVWDENEGSYVGRLPSAGLKDEMEREGHSKQPILSVIRNKCIDCSGNSNKEVRLCAIVSCPLWPYRMGENPFRVELSEEQRWAQAKRMRDMRAIALSHTVSELAASFET